MLTIARIHSYVKMRINSLGRFIVMDLPKSVLICFCERCGYGLADHPKTQEKPWVTGVWPRHCEGCGSPHWDVPIKGGTVAVRAKSRVDRVSFGLGSRRILPDPAIKLPRVAITNSARLRRPRMAGSFIKSSDRM